MASTVADVADHDDRSSDPRDHNDEIINDRVYVTWTPVIADTDANTSSPSTLTISLGVRIHYNATLSQASLQLQLRGVVLKKRLRPKSFFLFIPPERVESLTFVNTEYSTLSGNNIYRLEMLLTEPLDLVGPPSHGHQEGWPGGKAFTRNLRSLAATLRFTLLVPTAAVTKTNLLNFCAAVSKPEGLHSLTKLYEIKTLYGGVGGYVYTVKSMTAPSSPGKGLEDLPSRSPESEVSTVPYDTPPSYRDAAPPPGYTDVVTRNNEGNAPGKRESSEDPDLCRPPKRRGGIPLSSFDHATSATTHPAGDWSKEAERLTQLEPALGNIIRFLVAENEAHAQTIKELRKELEDLKKDHADLEQQIQETSARQDDVEGAVESLDCQVCALEENHEEVKKCRDEMEDAVHECVKNAIPQLVTDVLEEVSENMPPSVKDAIDDQVDHAVNRRFSIFQTRFCRAFEAE